MSAEMSAECPRTGGGSAGREGASYSLQGEQLETVEQRHGNFRQIQRGGPPEKFSGRMDERAANERINGRLTGERSAARKKSAGELRANCEGKTLRPLERSGGPSELAEDHRRRIYPFLHRNGRRAAQGPGNGPQMLKDGNGRKHNRAGLFSVKSHDRGGGPQPPHLSAIMTG